jgi:hypothetical protein
MAQIRTFIHFYLALKGKLKPFCQYCFYLSQDLHFFLLKYTQEPRPLVNLVLKVLSIPVDPYDVPDILDIWINSSKIA